MDGNGIMDWVGRTEERRITAEHWPVHRLLALLDAPDIAAGTPVPDLSHWCYFAPDAPQAQIGEDGHPRRGGFLPPITLPRRMWAASDITFHAPIPLGANLSLMSEVASISEKHGNTGTMIFVKVHHRCANAAGLPLLEEVQTLVYRDDPAPDAPPPSVQAAPEGADWSQSWTPDLATVFRYSAVTFNAHRIHYDAPYVTGVEGYPGVIVQGQLLATYMRRAMPGVTPKRFSFRAVRPVIAGATIHAEGKANDAGGLDLWIRDGAGNLHMTGRADLA